MNTGKDCGCGHGQATAKDLKDRALQPNTQKADPKHERMTSKADRGEDHADLHHIRQGENNKSPAGG